MPHLDSTDASEGTLDGHLFGAEQACFGCGPNHPFGFRLTFVEDGDELVTRFLPEERYQGAPGIMHGGLVFTLADELAAWAVITRLGKFGFTARFGGKLSSPARMGLEVEGRARIVRSTTRTAEVEATLRQDGKDVFRGSFTFVILDYAAAGKLLGKPLPPEWARFAR